MSRVQQPPDDRVVSFQGRKFASFAVQYNLHCIPVDEAEERRQLQLHGILREVLDGVVVPPIRFPPRGVDEPMVLDCGFGKGAWIDDLLSEHENSIVTGVDMFLGTGDEEEGDDDDDDEGDTDEDDGDGVQEFVRKRWNLNAPFREDRSNTRLQPGSFDLINSRCLADGLNGPRWLTYIADLKQLLKPGGWVQMVEQYPSIQSQSGQAIPYLRRWWHLYSAALAGTQKNPQIGRELKGKMESQGFDNIHERVERLPIGDWDARHASLGQEILDSVEQMLEALTLWPLLRFSRSRIAPDEYQSLLFYARRELRTRGARLYYQVYCVVGRRPPRR